MQTKEIYNEIADEFDMYRTKIWPCVSRFLKSKISKSSILDIGCGNGKNMVDTDLLTFTGIDFSNSLVAICQKKGLNVIEADMRCLPFNDNTFDGFISIASYHHLENDQDRQQALHEMYRVLKPDGTGLIVVWAKEQDGSKFNFVGTSGQNQFGLDEIVPWKSKNNCEYKRYYHIYQKNDLVDEIKAFSSFIIENIGFEKGNWYVHLKKL
jgi:ubiquinone/menaquinone biosynthesis C-methylase UbiE